MMKYRYIILFFISLYSTVIYGQEALYIPRGSTVFIGNQNPVSVFGYLMNDGNISMQKNTTLNFYGKLWINGTGALLTDETTTQNSSQGGLVSFIQPNPLFGNLGQQVLQSSFTDSVNKGASFSNILLNNQDGLILVSDLSVLNTLWFLNGHIYVNNKTVSMGDAANPGRLMGYNRYRYFVTDTAVSDSYVRIKSLPFGSSIEIPIGVTDKNYSPIVIKNTSQKDDFFAGVFTGVYQNATTGNKLTDSVVNLTWKVKSVNTAGSNTTIILKNYADMETPFFHQNRLKSFISEYNGTQWDFDNYFSPQNTAPDFLLNKRNISLSSSVIFLTKRSTDKISGIKFFIPNAFSPNGDNINDRWMIEALNKYPGCRVTVFDRYGQLLFYSEGYEYPWDGSFNGKPVPIGTYYYIIDLKSGEKISGSVTLLK